MPHVSPQKVDQETLKKIYEILFSSVGNRNISPKDQKDAFGELLTHTEKIMIGKRLAAVSLLSQGVKPYHVSGILKMSSATTSKFQIKLENGKLSKVNKLCTVLRKGPLQNYIENLFKPLPKYGTSPSKLFKEY